MSGTVQLLLLFGLLVMAHSDCPPGSIESVKLHKCYQLSALPVGFSTAERICSSAAGHLTSVINSYENELIVQLAKEQLPPNTVDFWIGGTDVVKPGQFEWTDGSVFNYTHWKHGIPRSRRDPDLNCVSVEVNSTKWDIDYCFEEKPYVCEVTKPYCPPQKCDSEWTYFNGTDSCYRTFYRSTFDDAEAHCHAFGAHLTSLHSDEERLFVSAHTTITSWEDFTWVGLHSTDGNTWYWTDGTPTDYVPWGPNRPRGRTDLICAQIYADNYNDEVDDFLHKLDDAPCSYSMRNYVCKKKANE